MVYPRSYQERRADRLRHAFEMFDIAGERDDFSAVRDPDYDYAKKAEQMAFQAAKLRTQAAMQRAKAAQAKLSSYRSRPRFETISSPSGRGSGSLQAFINAIAGKESGGRYGAVNPDSGALGKYQIMPSNIPSWSQEALGRQVSSQAFLSSPKLQERIARYKLRQYFRKYGPAGAASAWYSGSPDNWNSKTAQGEYPSVHDYVMAILEAMRG